MVTFSVITPNFNSWEKLAETAATVLHQDIDLEYIIMDGGSTDRSIEIAHRLSSEHRTRVRLFSEADGGIYDAMNKGINVAGGRYLFFLGAGDLLLPGVLRQVKELLPSHDRGFVYGNALWKGKEYDGPFTWKKICETNICHQAIFHGRDIFRICGNYEVRYKVCADWGMNLRCFGSRAITKIYLPLTIAYFEEGGVTEGGDPLFLSDRARIIRRALGLRCYITLKLNERLYHLRRVRRKITYRCRQLAGILK